LHLTWIFHPLDHKQTSYNQRHTNDNSEQSCQIKLRMLPQYPK